MNGARVEERWTDVAHIPTAVRTLLRPRVLVGATAGTVIGGDREVEDHVALSLWAGRIPTVEAHRLSAVGTGDGLAITGFWSIPFLARLPYTTDMGWEKVTNYAHNLFPSGQRWVLVLAIIGVVVMDYRLGIASPITIAQQVRAIFPLAPIIVLSDVFGMPTDIAPYVQTFVRKGDPEHLLSEIRSALAN